MKLSVLVTAFLLLVLDSVHPTELVYDPVNHGTNVANQITNIAQFTATTLNTAKTALNTLKTYENTVLQVARMGNPAALKSLPGVSNIAELYQIYGQLTADYQQIQRMTNPQNLQYTFNSILSTYKLPTWNGFVAANGVTVQPNQGVFQFPTANYNVAANVQQELAQLDRKKQTLTQQRDSALQSLQSANDQSTVQKFQSIVTALNGAIADINQSEQQLFNQGRLQQSRNGAAQQIFQRTQQEQVQASDYQAIDAGLNALPLGQMNGQPVLWGSN
jgi:hypothetical protein